MTRIRLLFTALCLMLGLLAAACGGSVQSDGSSGGDELRSVSVRLDWTPLGYHAPIAVAIEEGYYEEEGLDVAMGEGQGSGTTAQVVANGQDDFGWADLAAVMPIIAEGAPIKAVSVVSQQTPLFIASKPEAGIAEPADLEGKRVGVAAGGSDQAALPVFLEAAGVDESQVDVVTFDASAKVQVLVDDRVDAIVALTNAQLPVLEQLGVEVERIPLSEYVNTASFSILARDEMIDQDPDVVEGFVRATLKGWEYTVENKERAIDVLAGQFEEVEKDVALRQLEETILLLHTERTEGEPIGVANPDDIADTEEIIGETADMEVTGDPGNYYTDAFLPTDG